METKRKYTVIILLILSFVFIYSKCTKELPIPDCSGNCSTINFSGNVLNIASGAAIGNAQIKITTPGDYGTVDTVYIVGVVKTNASGNFSVSKSIDTTIHKYYTIQATMPQGYITSPVPLDEYNSSSANIQNKFLIITNTDLQHIQFGAFPATKLAIKLHRTSAIPSAGLYLGLNFSISNSVPYPPNVYYGSSFDASMKNTDTVIYLETTPTLNTTIHWSGISKGNVLVSGADSIACQANNNNQISINY